MKQPTLRSRLFRTKIFKKLADPIVKDMREEDGEALQKTAQILEKTIREEVINNELPKLVESEIKKAKAIDKKESMMFRNPKQYNSWTNSDRKIGSDVPFSYLRRLAVVYPIARACINRRVRQMTQLSWDVTTIEGIEDEEGYKSQIEAVKTFLRRPMGHKTRFREMVSIMTNDIMTVDATCFEYRKTFGGDLLNLIPVDPTTIVLKVEENGTTPEPPEIAYAQYIAGQKIAEFTTDEMLYEAMNNRSNSPYGLAPLESLVLQAEGALYGSLYNLNYLKENNVPEGFLELPEDVAANQEQVEQWQLWFDALMSGDRKMTHRLKIIPGGSNYTPAKKPEDMSFEKFELWLAMLTCAVFEVQPQEIGLTYQVNKATGESQQDIQKERGLTPLANFTKEVFDDVIQDTMGYPGLQLIWVNLNPVDRKEEIEIAKTEIQMGAKSVDEYRVEQGKEPIGLGHYVMTSRGPILLKDILNPPQQSTDNTNNGQNSQDNQDSEDSQNDNAEKMEYQEIKRWKKAIYNDIDNGRKLRTTFPPRYGTKDVINSSTREIIESGLKGIKTKNQAKLLFDQFLDPTIRSSMKLLETVAQLRQIEDVQ